MNKTALEQRRWWQTYRNFGQRDLYHYVRMRLMMRNTAVIYAAARGWAVAYTPAKPNRS